MRASRCDHCGSLCEAPRCRYCGAAARGDDLVAAGFGAADDAFHVMRDAQGVVVTVLGARSLRVDVPPETEVGPAVVGCAWTKGEFADLDVSVAVRFERAADGIAAGVWLRSRKGSAIAVTLAPSGRVSITARRDEGRRMDPLGAASAPSGWRADAPLVVRARVAGDLATLYLNGVAATSVACPKDLVGGVDLVVDVPQRDRGCVVFEDVCARLP